MDVVYLQPLKELLQLSTYFKEELVVLVQNESQESIVKKSGLIPCFVVSESTKDLNKIKSLKAVIGGSIKTNEFCARIKADFLLQPSNTKQFFDVGLAKKLSDNNTTVVFMLSDFIDKNSFEKHQFWKNYLEVAKHCRKKKTKLLVASGSKDPLLLRAPKVREAMAILLGLSKKEVAEGMKSIEKNKKY